MTPKETMQRYFETWNARDFDAFEAQLAEDITFAGPLGTATGPAECRRGIEGLAAMMDRVEVVAMVADGPDVITWFELHTPQADPVPVANWARVEAGRVRRVRVTFDPRPLLGVDGAARAARGHARWRAKPGVESTRWSLVMHMAS